MAKPKRVITENTIKRKITEGRGKGTGSEYLSWLLVQEVLSLGKSTRILGWTTGRMHTLLSKLEAMYFYVLDWMCSVTDIQEQYVLLPVEETIFIAQQCGIKYPKDRKTKVPIPLTTDFLITILSKNGLIKRARTVKYSKDLTKRTMQKFELERRYFLNRGIDDYGVLTEYDIPLVLARNIEIIHNYRDLKNRLILPPDQLYDIARVLTCEVGQASSLTDATKKCDKYFSIKKGTSITVAYHLLATRQWRVDMNVPIRSGNPLVLLGTNLKLPAFYETGVR